MKWRYYCVEKLEKLPAHFPSRIQDIMTIHSFTLEELDRRKTAFLDMWREVQPGVEQELSLHSTRCWRWSKRSFYWRTAF